MKKVCGILLLAALLFASCSHSSSGGNNNESTYSVTSTGTSNSSGSSVTATVAEQAVITEMNFARTDPRGYVTSRLVPQRSNPTVNLSGTSTYQSALEECIAEMNAMTSVGSLTFGSGLYKAAQSWVSTQGAGNQTGHDSNLFPRIEQYCSYTTAGENLAYGYETATDIVIALLVDDGVSNRGHRHNILNGSYTHAGAAIGSHGRYRIMCCIDYAGGYRDK